MRLLIFILLIFITAKSGYSQCNSNETFSNPGIYPNHMMPNAHVNDYYQESVYVVHYSDTVINNTYTVFIDSSKILSIENIPNGLNYTCEFPDCSYASINNSLPKQCITFSGTPNSESTSDSVKIISAKYITLLGDYYELQDTAIVILKALNDASIKTIENNFIFLYPNPVSNHLFIHQNFSELIDHITIYSSQGQVIRSINRKFISETNYIEFLEPSGVYTVAIQLTNGEIHREFIVKN